MLGEKMIPIEDAERLIRQAESEGREDLAAQLQTYLDTFTPAQRKRAQKKKQKPAE